MHSFVSLALCRGVVLPSLRLGGVLDSSSDRGFWVTRAGLFPRPPCQEHMPIGGVVSAGCRRHVLRGGSKGWFWFRAFELSTGVCVCACISVDAFALLLVGALVLVGAWWCLVIGSAIPNL